MNFHSIFIGSLRHLWLVNMEKGTKKMDIEQEPSERGVEATVGLGVGSFVLGALLGAGVALLLAPQSVREIQENIKRKAKEIQGSAEDRLIDHNPTLEKRVNDLRDGIESQIRLVKDIVESSQRSTGGISQEFGGFLKGSGKKEEEGSALPEKLRILGGIGFEEDADEG
jgi:gas vesicle protein